MKKTDYIKNYLKEVPSEIPPFEGEERGTWLVSKDTEVYVGLKGLCDEMESVIDLLAEHEITLLDSQEKWKERNKYAVACIGFSEKEQKWYGWSHRGFYGFGIGSEVKRGDCAYKPKNKEDYEQRMLEFWKDECYKNMKIKHIDDTKFNITWKYTEETPNEKLRNTKGSTTCYYPNEYGRGEWKAETLEDAKQMAMDYAEFVS